MKVVIPGTTMTADELALELRRQGFGDDDIRRLEVARPAEYLGHRRCGCGAFQPYLGGQLDSCAACGWCRHPAVTGSAAGSVCGLCGAADPTVVEIPEDAGEIHWLAPDGTVLRTERG